MTFLLETLKLGLANLLLHKLRSLLTMLGIIFGVAAVITMVAVGEGSKRTALEEIRALGADNIILRSVKPVQEATGEGQEASHAVYGIRRSDVMQISETIEGIEIVSPLKRIGTSVTHGPKQAAPNAFGVEPSLYEITSLKPDRGRLITQGDMDSDRPVAVIGNGVARHLFPLEDPLGREVRIDGQVFEVVGILRPTGVSGGVSGTSSDTAGGGSNGKAATAMVGRDINLDIHIPMTAARKRFGDIRRAPGAIQGELVEVNELFVRVRRGADVVNVADQIKLIFDPKGPNGDRAAQVSIIVPRELIDQAARTQARFNQLMVAIASISLLVGGIGIMNIMLASVTERTREIGIRRALGATRRHIVFQFLVETTLLSCIGGILGIGFGLGATIMIKLLSNIPEPAIVVESVIVSFVVAAGVGIFFGLYPAFAASRQDPIVALRHD